MHETYILLHFSSLLQLIFSTIKYNARDEKKALNNKEWENQYTVDQLDSKVEIHIIQFSYSREVKLCEVTTSRRF